ncbi:MAG: hypothetical protein HC817_16000 [Saprospiraceae bacterium]|nr:hypothetical protein [Saprospiraceae bacterium]
MLLLIGCQNSSNTLKTNLIGMVTTEFKRLEMNGMTIEWQHRGNEILFKINAPTEGWVALGFTETDEIVQSNLIFVGQKRKRRKVLNHYVVGFGNHQHTEALGGQTAARLLTAEEKNGRTTASFTMPSAALDKFHYNLSEGNELWFICAFSADDDLQHHSRMREHKKVIL